MKTKNIFYCSGFKQTLIKELYKQLMTREAVTYKSVIKPHKHTGDPSYYDKNPFNNDERDALKKAFRAVMNALKEKEPNCIRTDGKTKGTHYWYIGQSDDPLKEERQFLERKYIQDYVDFCKATAGMLPSGWLASFFENTPMLLDAKQMFTSGRSILQADQRDVLFNIDYLPLFYAAISEHRVCQLKVKPFDKPERIIIFHPQFLKGFNGRWFVFGQSEMDGHKPYQAYNVPLDRIVEIISNNVENVEYVAAEPGYYDNFFKNIIGVSHEKGEKTIDIRIKTLSEYYHGLIVTKKIHKDQDEIEPFSKHEDGSEYGLINLRIEPNKELMSRICSYRNGIEIVSPPEYRKKVIEEIQKMTTIYQ